MTNLGQQLGVLIAEAAVLKGEGPAADRPAARFPVRFDQSPGLARQDKGGKRENRSLFKQSRLLRGPYLRGEAGRFGFPSVRIAR